MTDGNINFFSDKSEEIKYENIIALNDAIQLAKYDSYISNKELEALKRRFWEDKFKIYLVYLKEKLNVINWTKNIIRTRRIKEYLSQLIFSDPNKIFALYEYFKDEDFAEEILIKATMKNPKLANIYFNSYKNTPYAKNILLAAVKSNPYLLIDFQHKIENEAYYNEIISAAKNKDKLISCAKDEKWVNYKNYIFFKDEPYAKEVLTILIRKLDYIWIVDYELFKNEPFAKDILIALAETNSEYFFKQLDKYSECPYLKELLLIATKQNPIMAMKIKDNIYKNASFAKDVLIEANNKDNLKKYIKNNPFSFFENFEELKNFPFVNELKIIAKNKENVLICLSKNSWAGIFYFDEYKNETYSEEMLEYYNKEHSRFVLSISDKFKTKIYSKKVLMSAGKKEPFFMVEYFSKFGDQPYAKDILMLAIDNDSSQLFYHIDQYKSKPYAKEILKMAVMKSPFQAYEFYSKYKTEPYAKEILNSARNEIDEIFFEKERDCLQVWRIINLFHSENDELRFHIISNFNENKLYKIICDWRAEIFTSSYNWILNKILIKLKNNNKDIYDLANDNSFDSLSTFIEAAASYWRLDELFNGISNDKKKKDLLDRLFNWDNNSSNSNNFVSLIEIIDNVKSPELLNLIKLKIKNNYEKGTNKNEWWIIAKHFSNKFKDVFFSNIPDKYKLPDIKWIKSETLFDSKWRNVQQYFFYNDEDWKCSFNSFISNYKSWSEWNIEDKWSFVIIKSRATGWKSITIYANKPEYDWTITDKKNWFDEIETNMNSMRPALESIVIVHRWHSYHASKTIARIPPIAKMVFLWSCGWFQSIWEVLDKSPDAQIISTKWIGTMTVNDPLFKAINNRILGWKDIIWWDVWKEITPKLKDNKDFWKYVRPDENLWALFYKKVQDLRTK